MGASCGIWSCREGDSVELGASVTVAAHVVQHVDYMFGVFGGAVAASGDERDE